MRSVPALGFALVLVALWSTSARADLEINTVVGDASWAGRTDPGDEVTRVRTHLAFVHALLVTRDVSALTPAQRDARVAALANLVRYIERGEFPRRTSDHHAGRRPRFIDDRGVHCAVGQLLADSGHEALARSIDARFEYAHVREMTEPALVAWASAHGFTVDELAMIQPGYSPPPSADSVREMLREAKDAIALRCAQKHAPMDSLMIYVVSDKRGRVTASTKSSEPFAKCFVQQASMIERGGHAYSRSPKEHAFLIDLSFTSPQRQLDKMVASWSPSCGPRPGPIAREATVEITSSREGLAIRASSTPTNALVDDCLRSEATRHFAAFGPGVWKLRAKQTIKIPPRVTLDPEALRAYAVHEATNCLPDPAPKQRSKVTVTARTDDPQFQIAATGSPAFSACMSEALGKRFAAVFRTSYFDGAKHVELFRIDADVNTTVTIELESLATRTKREEARQREMENRFGF